MLPYLLHSRHLYLPTFGVAAVLGLMLALALSQRIAKIVGIDPEALWNAGVFAIIAAFALSRLFLLAQHFGSFLAFPLLLLATPSLTPAASLLTALCTLLWLRSHKLPLLDTLDAWAPSGTLLWAFLALGHFAEGSDPGLPASSHLGIRMGTSSTPLYPVALYAAIIALILTAAIYRRLAHRSLHGPGRGESAGLALAGVGSAQFLLSFLRQPGLEMPGGLDALQWVALGMLSTGAALILQGQRTLPITLHDTHSSREQEPV